MMQSLNRNLRQISSTCNNGDSKQQVKTNQSNINENVREQNWTMFESSRFKTSAYDLSSPKESDFTILDGVLRINDSNSGNETMMLV